MSASARPSLAIAAFSIAAAMPGQAAAQAVASTEVAEDDRLAEIVVTARKREESLQSAPLAVTAVTNQELFQRGLRDISDVALFTPGFSMQNIQSGTEQPFIRGMSSTSFERTLQTSSSFVSCASSSVVAPRDQTAHEYVIDGPRKSSKKSLETS